MTSVKTAIREVTTRRRLMLGLMFPVMLPMLAAVAGCDPTVPPPGGEPPHPSPGTLNVVELATRLNLSIVKATDTVYTLKNANNVVVLYSDPCGQAFVNGQPVGNVGGYYHDGQTMFVPAEVEPQIRHMLRDPRAGPIPTPTPTPAPTPPSIVYGKVVIDAGHGGDDAGTIGAGKSHPEKDVNLAIALAVRKALEARGITVIMTRRDDTFIPLDDRVNIANRSGAGLFVAIHADYSEDRSNEGHTVITPRIGNAEASRAANLISQRMVSAGSPIHGVRADVRRLRVLEATRIPAVLVETGFLSNTRDTSRLLSPSYQQQIGQAIADGIADYLKRR